MGDETGRVVFMLRQEMELTLISIFKSPLKHQMHLYVPTALLLKILRRITVSFKASLDFTVGKTLPQKQIKETKDNNKKLNTHSGLQVSC